MSKGDRVIDISKDELKTLKALKYQIKNDLDMKIANNVLIESITSLLNFYKNTRVSQENWQPEDWESSRFNQQDWQNDEPFFQRVEEVLNQIKISGKKNSIKNESLKSMLKLITIRLTKLGIDFTPQPAFKQIKKSTKLYKNKKNKSKKSKGQKVILGRKSKSNRKKL
jgi:hypothetical protein